MEMEKKNFENSKTLTFNELMYIIIAIVVSGSIAIYLLFHSLPSFLPINEMVPQNVKNNVFILSYASIPVMICFYYLDRWNPILAGLSRFLLIGLLSYGTLIGIISVITLPFPLVHKFILGLFLYVSLSFPLIWLIDVNEKQTLDKQS